MPVLQYMLGTNIVSEVVRRPAGDIALRAAALEPGSISISIIVAAELRYSAARCRSARLSSQLEAVFSAIATLPLSAPTDTHYGSTRAELERVGRPIDRNHLLIAAPARALGATLVTKNVREFSVVPDLEIDDWR